MSEFIFNAIHITKGPIYQFTWFYWALLRLNKSKCSVGKMQKAPDRKRACI